MNTPPLWKTLPLAFAFASAGALAQDDMRGCYVGLSVGQSRVTIEDSAVTVLGATASSFSKDETDTGFKLYAGYRFNRHFALEGGWTDLGSFRATRNVTAPAVGSLSAEIEASGFHFDAVGILPLQQFFLFGKLGLMYATTETSRSSTGAVVLAGPAARRTARSSSRPALAPASRSRETWRSAPNGSASPTSAPPRPAKATST